MGEGKDLEGRREGGDRRFIWMCTTGNSNYYLKHMQIIIMKHRILGQKWLELHFVKRRGDLPGN